MKCRRLGQNAFGYPYLAGIGGAKYAQSSNVG
jgi:hypothetical protein